MTVMEKYCYCCSLRTGAIIISTLSIIGDLVCLGIAALFLLAAKSLEEELWKKPLYEREAYEKAILATRISAYTTIFIAVIGLLVIVFLILAIGQNRAGFVVPWLAWAGISVILALIIIIYNLIFKNWNMAFSLPGVAFAIYNWIAMLSYHLELKK